MDARTLDQLRAIAGPSGLITAPEELHTYECDGLTNFRVLPSAVVLPTSAEQVQAVVRVCHRERIPFVARGSGTGLSGGALPIKGGIVISLARMNRILEVDYANARVVVEPGVLNASVTQQVSPNGYFTARSSSDCATRISHAPQEVQICFTCAISISTSAAGPSSSTSSSPPQSG